MSEPETALEQGWLLQEMESRLGCSIEELARRFDRSRNWVASRLALVETLPESVQQLVREGKIAASLAMRYLVPVARISLEHCQRMAALSPNSRGPHGKPANCIKPGGAPAEPCASALCRRRSCSAKRHSHPTGSTKS